VRISRRILWLALGVGHVAAVEVREAAAAADAPGSQGANAEEPAPSDMLKRYLLREAKLRFDARRKAIAAIKTPADVEQRQKALRAFFVLSLGDMPERTPLNPQVVGTLKRDGYRVEKIIFESRPRHHVTANLYLPEAQRPFPGVLLPCGHSDNGKAGETYQRICILLAKRGMAVLCYDPIGQGERFQLLDAGGKPRIRGTTEHTMAGIGALLIGRELAGYRIWDGFRALDYLASRPEVDSKRLGCTGNSGGGTMTAYLMALDDRIKVAAPSCYITSLERLFETIGPQDAEQNITGQVAAGMEHADYITMRAPKPTLLSVGTRDFFDIRGSWDTFREVKLIYGRLGFGERIELFESDEEHGFTKPRRVATARWMSRWLVGRDEAFDEPDFPIATDAELQCTRSGQVLTDFHGASVFELNRERERELRKLRETVAADQSIAEFRAEVKKRLGLLEWKSARVPVKTDYGSSTTALRFSVEPGIVLSEVETLQDIPGGDDTTLLIVGADRIQELATASIAKGVGGRHRRAALLDLRGLGETSPAPAPPGRESPFGRDWREAFMALSIDKPLLGGRAVELLNVLETLNAETGILKASGFHVVGVGVGGPVVLHAALLDERGLIKKVTIQNSLVSWSNIVEKGVSRDQLSNVVPGVLGFYDLPDLAARLAPLPLEIVGSVDAEGKAVRAADVREIYARCVKAYGQTEAFGIR
jgi:dienelactone hydrolase/pimeloyl-ACP methyl ester carboxylesterase